MIPEHQPERSPNDLKVYKWKALFTVALGTIMGAMDMSITNISFPILTKVFKAELATVMWVTLSFSLVCTSLMLIMGKISDLMGRKKIYTAGMAIFTLGLIACSFAQSLDQLILFRTFQAVGAAMTISCGTAIVTDAFPPEELGKGLGLFSVSVSLGFILGPILGGFLLNWLDWRSIFYIRAPVGIIALFMAFTLLKQDQSKTGKIKLDLMGTLTSSAGLFCLIFGVSQINKIGQKSPLVHMLMGLGLLILIIFIFVERRAQDPIVDLTLFKNRVFSCAIWALFLSFVASPAFILIMPFYLMQGIGLTPSETGLLLAVTSMAAIAAGPVSGWLSDRFGRAWFSTLGAGAIAVSFFFMRGFELQTQVTAIIPVLALMGSGIGMFHAPNNSTIMGAVARDRLGTASALIATQRNVGFSLGMTIAGTIFSARRIIHQAELSRQGIETAHVANLSIPFAFQDALLVSIFLQLLVVILSLVPDKRKAIDERGHH